MPRNTIRETIQSVGRGKARNRAIALTAASSVFSKLISVVVTFITIPLTLGYLGPERFGMWMVLTSFSLLLGFIDLGIGNGTLTAVAASSSEKDNTQLRRLISSAYAVSAIVGASFLTLVCIAHPLVHWQALFNVKDAIAAEEAGPGVIAFSTVLAVMTPLNIIFRIQLGLQQGFRSNLWQSGGSVLSLAAVFMAAKYEMSIVWLVVALFGTPLLTTVGNTLHFFVITRPDIRPKLGYIHFGTMQKLLGTGALFFVLQVCAALMFQSNAIIVAQILGVEAVSTYSIAERMFGLVSFAVMLVVAPLWPAYGEALASNDIGWIKRTVKRSIVFSASLSFALGMAVVVAGDSIVRVWVGDGIVVPFTLLVGFGVWKVMESVGGAVSIVLNGMNEIRLQAVLAVANTAASLGLKLWLVEAYGLTGVMMGTIISYSIFSLPWMAWSVRSALGKHEARVTGETG